MTDTAQPVPTMAIEDALLALGDNLKRSVDAACTEMDRLRKINKQMSDLLGEFVQGGETFKDSLPNWVAWRIEKASAILAEIQHEHADEQTGRN